MRSPILSGLCALALAADVCAVFLFEPENSTNIQLFNRLPSVQNLAASQLTNNHGSWWTGSLITGKNHHQFFVTSQYVSSYGTQDFYRASVLDLDSLEHHFFVQLGDGSYPPSDPSRLVVGVDGNGFEGISDDNLGTMRTHSTHEDVTFDLICHRTALPLVNGGPDIIFRDDGKAYGWGLPACSTYGTITVRDQTIQIDTRHSLTWYSRQWGSDRSYNNWTWFHLHMPGGFKLSIWAGDIDGDATGECLVTMRDRKGLLTLTRASVTPGMEHTWYSSADDKTYPLSWTVHIPDYIAKLTIASIIADQLIVGPTSLETAYEGYVTFIGVFLSADVAGYGMVEIVG